VFVATLETDYASKEMNTFGDDWHPPCGFQWIACFLNHSLYQDSVHLHFIFERVDRKFMMIDHICDLLVD
jgi:hypothetical protein